MKVPYIMTPGPTQVRENVRFTRAVETINPDLDPQFYDFYKETCKRIGSFLKTENQVRILGGEGILGLEAACASLTEVGDRVLVIANGIFGEGFADFARMYGGEVVFFRGDNHKSINVNELKLFLEKDSRFKYATLVHCDTPSGILNNIKDICLMLHEKGIISVVDSVAAMGGEDVNVDEWKIDIVIGASQKCVSAPPGLTFLSISSDAFNVMENRQTPIASSYGNLYIWKDYYENKWFPYTPPISDIMGLRTAIDNILEEGIDNMIARHKKVGEAARNTVLSAGLQLYTKEGYSNTVTVIKVPKGLKDDNIRKYMLEKYGVFIAGSFGYLAGKVFRIGNMGENAKAHRVAYTLFALQKTLEHFNYVCTNDMSSEFLKNF